MLFSLKKKEPEELDAAHWAARFEQSEERRELFLLAARTMIQCIREFVLDLQETKSADFKAVLADFAETLGSDEKTRRLQSLYESRKDAISAFAQRQKDYLRDRETSSRVPRYATP